MKPVLADYTSMTLDALLREYAGGPTLLDSRILTLSADQIDRTFPAGAEEGQWSLRVLAGHLLDAEIAFIHRMRRIAGENRPAYAAWDEDAFAERRLYNQVPDARNDLKRTWEALTALRAWNGAWLSSLPEGDLARTGIHPERGEQTLRTVLEYCTWHIAHHGRYANMKVESLLKNR